MTEKLTGCFGCRVGRDRLTNGILFTEGNFRAQDWRTALDEQLMQKVLPRVRGDASASEAIDAFLDLVSDGYPLSAAKTRAMRRDLDEHGFVAYF